MILSFEEAILWREMTPQRDHSWHIFSTQIAARDEYYTQAMHHSEFIHLDEGQEQSLNLVIAVSKCSSIALSLA